MSQWSVSRVGSCLAGVAMGIALLYSGVGRAEPGSTATSDNYEGLPCDPDGGLLLGPADLDAPPALRAFLESTDQPWNIFWDRVLDTPSLVYPYNPFVLPQVPEEDPLDPSEHPVLRDVRGFLEAHRDFLGAGPENLAPLYARPFADGLHVSALQMHQGLPVRGSAFRMLINADRTICFIHNRLSRHLPPIEIGSLTPQDVAGIAEQEGLSSILLATPQVVFPGEPDDPVAACAVVALDATGKEVEVLYSTVTGDRIASRPTALHQDVPCNSQLELEGTLLGHYPDPDNPCTTPLDYSADTVYPIIDAGITVGVPGPCPTLLTRWTDEDGFYSATVMNIPENPAYFVQIDFGNRHFELEHGDPRYMQPVFELQGTLWVPPRYNTELSEYQSFHLMATHHLRESTTEAATWVEKYEVPWESRGEPLHLELTRNDYTYLLNPYQGTIVLGSDERRPTADNGRLRKMVPTIVYHEYGHEFIGRLSGEVLPTLAHEGVADAFAGYVGRVGTLGYATATQPNADIVARDLAHDVTAYPLAPRRTVAGAFWELWDATLALRDPDDPKIGRQSPFAKGLLTRWLAASWVRGPVGVGGRTIESNPRLGHALYLLADHDTLGGDGLLANGFEHDDDLLRAFGRRNLFQFRFIRGDANTDGALDLSDAITILGYLFLGATEIQCADALDSNDSGAIDLSDAVVLLYHLFLGGRDLPRPFPTCSYETTLDDALGCWGGECGFISPAW